VFHPDDLRLSSLSTGEVPGLILTHFDFQNVNIGTPPQTFGEVPRTMPPGLVFSLGSSRTSGGPVTPIRYMNFEPNRIVIDVAGPSFVIDQIIDELRSLLSEFRTPDGSPLIGEPIDTLEYSEVSARLSVPFEDLLNKSLFAAAQQGFAEDGEELQAMPVTIIFQVGDPASPIQQPALGQALQVRAGTRVEERIYFSIAGLTTDDNLAWLEVLDDRVSNSKPKSS
jgi:hypothetical protein